MKTVKITANKTYEIIDYNGEKLYMTGFNIIDLILRDYHYGKDINKALELYNVMKKVLDNE